MPRQLRMPAARFGAGEPLQLLHLRSREGARGATAQTPRDPSLHRRRGVHGGWPDRQPPFVVPARDALAFSVVLSVSEGPHCACPLVIGAMRSFASLRM